MTESCRYVQECARGAGHAGSHLPAGSWQDRAGQAGPVLAYSRYVVRLSVADLLRGLLDGAVTVPSSAVTALSPAGPPPLPRREPASSGFAAGGTAASGAGASTARAGGGVPPAWSPPLPAPALPALPADVRRARPCCATRPGMPHEGSCLMLRIGRGGGGSNPRIPRCGWCGAAGGGGHGGLCPNAGLPQEMWTTPD